MTDHAERTAVLSGLDELARGLDYGQARTIREYILAAEAEVARLREALEAVERTAQPPAVAIARSALAKEDTDD